MKSFPVLVEVIICLQAMLSLSFANAFDMYVVLSEWDLILHGLLGVELLAFGYFILINNGGRKMTNLGKLIFLLIFVAGVAGLWEILEYIAYNITGHDFQHMTDFKVGDTPLDDTMTDMIISLITAFITYLVVVIESFISGKLINVVTKSLLIDKENEND